MDFLDSITTELHSSHRPSLRPNISDHPNYNEATSDIASGGCVFSDGGWIFDVSSHQSPPSDDRHNDRHKDRHNEKTHTASSVRIPTIFLQFIHVRL